MNRTKSTQQVMKPMDFFGGDRTVDDDGEELTPGIRPASEILAELQSAVAEIKRR